MKLYHVARTRSVRVRWLMEELGLDYELEEMPFDPKALQSVDYLELSPFGKVPVLVDGATTMFESVAIMQYLLDRYGNGALQPDDQSPEYGTFLQWMHFGEATLMGPMAMLVMHSIMLPEEERDARSLRFRARLGQSNLTPCRDVPRPRSGRRFRGAATGCAGRAEGADLAWKNAQATVR